MPTALLSVFDKTGIREFAEGLHECGWRIISSGGTAKALTDAGVPVVDLAELTGFPPILGHRVVTLSPKIHGGLLADLHNPDHVADLERYGIEPISLTVVNLYPFASEPGIELIDIGGPAMIRASAKNHAHVAVVVDPGQYGAVLDEIKQSATTSDETRRQLARTAFAHTAAYDAQIVTWFDQGDPLPPTMHLALEHAQSLRYGENPHQRGARYRNIGSSSWWDRAVQHGGKEMSYLNVYDTEAAWRSVNQFDAPACVIVKHANPCGVAVSEDITSAYVLANACDPVSAFGGIVACNRIVTEALATELVAVFTEVVIAPGYEPAALGVLSTKPNLRVLSASAPSTSGLDVRAVDGGLLVQDRDRVTLDRATWRVVTDAEPDESLWNDLIFAWQVCATVSSNAIVLAKDRQAFGIGAGQQNRLDSARIAAERANGRAAGGVCASDAFFPFRDGLDAVAGHGVRAVIQPGGSVRDSDVIAAANEHGIALIFTGERHFRH